MLQSLRIILLALWVGAMAAFAFIFAPIAFQHEGPTPAFAATIAACVRWIVAAGNWIAFLTMLITWRGGLETTPRREFINLLLALAICAGGYEVYAIVPRMEVTPLLTPAYEALHRESSAVYGAAFLAAAIALVLTARSGYRST